jgi:cytochrome c oxidase subunit II
MDITSAFPSNIFSFATEQARTIVYLNYVVMAVCFVIGMTVLGLLTAVAIKFRQRAGDESEPSQYEGNLKLEITWTLIPALILLVLGILTFMVMSNVAPSLGKRQPDVIVNARQWWWEYRYPKTGVVTANELYLPEGVNSVIQIVSGDVVHSFWVPNFGQKMDAIPGHPSYLFLKPIQKGVFTGACSEYCGADHALMRIVAKVVSQEDFDAWTKSQLKVPAAPTEATAQHGEKLFLSQTCSQCHTVSGSTASALVGPDLTHLASRETIGSGLLPNTTENVADWIMNAQVFKPGCHMPQMRLSHSDAHDIAVYLESLK